MDRENVFAYLDQLRESGKINMFGAAPYIQDMFEYSRAEAREILFQWMETYAERKKNQ